MLGVYKVASDHDRPLALDKPQVGIVYTHGAHAALLGFVVNNEAACTDVGARHRAEHARFRGIRLDGHGAVNKHVVQKAAHAVLHKRLNMLARSQPPRLAVHIGKRAHEQRGPARLTNSIDNAGDKQIRDNGREQAPRP